VVRLLGSARDALLRVWPAAGEMPVNVAAMATIAVVQGLNHNDLIVLLRDYCVVREPDARSMCPAAVTVHVRASQLDERHPNVDPRRRMTAENVHTDRHRGVGDDERILAR
jgi:hypothetical protein